MPRRYARLLALAMAAVLLLLVSAPTATAGTAATPTGLPPAAPTPTSGERSPGAPDPHPPAGGIGPAGEPVGGAALQGRGLITPRGAPALPTGLTASAWVLVDLGTGDVLAARNPHGRFQPASILKILTTDTLLPLLPGDRSVTASAAAAGTEGSHAGLVAGGHYTVDQLFAGLLLASGNDAATALAEAAGGVTQTVAAMNAKALALGAYDTFVQTPSGLDGWQQLTSAYDMALFLQSAVHDPRFVAYDRQASAVLPAQRVGPHFDAAIPLVNQSAQFLRQVPGGVVAKTGFTDAAQHTYLAAAQRGGRELGIVFLRAQRWPTDQWQQAAALFNWGFRLPAATAAVGHLDAAYVAPGGVAASSAAATSQAPAPVAAAVAAARPRFNSHGIVYGTLATLAVLIVVTGLATAAAHVRHRVRPKWGSAKPRGRAHAR